MGRDASGQTTVVTGGAEQPPGEVESSSTTRWAGRVGIPAFCVLALLVTAVAIVAVLPVKVDERSCGTPLSVVTDEGPDTTFAEECEEKALRDLAFGAVLAGVGLVCALASVAMLRGRHAPRAAPGAP